jgi:hypothetical protein
MQANSHNLFVAGNHVSHQINHKSINLLHILLDLSFVLQTLFQNKNKGITRGIQTNMGQQISYHSVICKLQHQSSISVSVLHCVAYLQQKKKQHMYLL